jgi:hypothetical protein
MDGMRIFRLGKMRDAQLVLPLKILAPCGGLWANQPTDTTSRSDRAAIISSNRSTAAMMSSIQDHVEAFDGVADAHGILGQGSSHPD